MSGYPCTLCKIDCGERSSMFSVPQDEYIRSEWENVCGIKFPQNARLCANHFTTADFTTTSPKRRLLKSRAVPSVNLTKSDEIEERRISGDKKIRATTEQLRCFVSFARKYPEILPSRNSFKSKRACGLWKELAARLNALAGPSRPVSKWKESMSLWIRSRRSRLGKASVISEFDEIASRKEAQSVVEAPRKEETEEGIGVVSKIIIKPEPQFVGDDHVSMIPEVANLPTLGFQSPTLEQYPTVPCSTVSLDNSTTEEEMPPIESFMLDNINCPLSPSDPSDDSKSPPSSKLKCASVNNMFEMIMESIKQREKREVETLAALRNMTAAINKLTHNIMQLKESL